MRTLVSNDDGITAPMAVSAEATTADDLSSAISH